MSVKDETVSALKDAYRSAYRAEESSWRSLTGTRRSMLSAAEGKVPQVTIRKWMAQLEGKQRLDTLNPQTQKVLDNLAEWCGPENLGNWIRASRQFNTDTDNAFRASMDLKAAAGTKTIAELDGERPDGALRRKLMAIATRINPTVELNLVRELYAEGPALLASGASSAERMEVAGMHMPHFNLSTVSLASRFDPIDTVYHEMWHSIEPVLSVDEQKALQAAFPGDSRMTHKERTAVAFARWATDHDSAPVDKAAHRGFRKALAGGKSMFGAIGSPRVEKIFQRAYAGEMGDRMVKAFRSMQGREAFLSDVAPSAAKVQTTQSRPRRGVRR